MDGTYKLRHQHIAEQAVLQVRGQNLRSHAPPAGEAVQAFDSNAAAVAAMNAEVLRLTADGWSVADIQLDNEEATMPPKKNHASDASDDDDIQPTSITRKEMSVTVNARENEVTPEQALATLGAEFERGCRELTIMECQPYDEPWYQTVAPWCTAVAKLGNRELERFIVDTFSETLTRQASVHCGDITGAFTACPRLSFAYVIGCGEITSLAHERLTDLTLMADVMSLQTIRAVLRGPCPALVRLALGFSYEQAASPGADAALLEALASNGLPALTELHIANPEDGAALLAALPKSPIWKQLRVLSIAGNVLEDEDRGFAILKKNRVAFSRLEKLYLPLEDILGHDDADLAELIPCIQGTDDLKAFDPQRYRAL